MSTDDWRLNSFWACCYLACQLSGFALPSSGKKKSPSTHLVMSSVSRPKRHSYPTVLRETKKWRETEDLWSCRRTTLAATKCWLAVFIPLWQDTSPFSSTASAFFLCSNLLPSTIQYTVTQSTLRLQQHPTTLLPITTKRTTQCLLLTTVPSRWSTLW